MPAAPCAPVPLTHLLYATASRRLGENCWPAPKPPKILPFEEKRRITRPPRDTSTKDAWHACEKSLRKDLLSGKLIAHAYVESTGHFRRIHPDYWREYGSALALSGAIYDLEDGRTFNDAVDGANVYVFDEAAKEWLIAHGVSLLDPYCPNALRMNAPRKAPSKTKYNWDQFEHEVMQRLDLYRSRSPFPTEAELVREMKDWCGLTWDRVPDRKLVLKHIRDATIEHVANERGI